VSPLKDAANRTVIREEFFFCINNMNLKSTTRAGIVISMHIVHMSIYILKFRLYINKIIQQLVSVPDRCVFVPSTKTVSQCINGGNFSVNLSTSFYCSFLMPVSDFV